MSGSPERTAHLAGAAAAGLVRALPVVEERIGAVPVLVGGLAVLSHLGAPHRATSDVDLVDSRYATARSLLEVLLASGAPRAGVVGAEVPTPAGPVRVDVLEVTDAHLANLPDDPTDRLHVLAHHWAATSTQLVRLVVWDGDAVRAEATAYVATPGPLVATKLQAAMNRGRAQQATDLLDVMALTFDERTSEAVDRELRAATPFLAVPALLHARHWFEQGAPSTLRTVRTVPAGLGYELDDILTTGRILVAALAGAAGGAATER